MLADEVDALVVCAGMDGALASVVAGLAPVPVIGVPTPIGYGAGNLFLGPIVMAGAFARSEDDSREATAILDHPRPFRGRLGARL